MHCKLIGTVTRLLLWSHLSEISFLKTITRYLFGLSDVTYLMCMQDIFRQSWIEFLFSFPEGIFIKRQIKCDKNNDNNRDFRSAILTEFPELSAYANVFSLWIMRGNKPTLIPLSAEINSFATLHRHGKELKRSLIYIRPGVSSRLAYLLGLVDGKILIWQTLVTWNKKFCRPWHGRADVANLRYIFTDSIRSKTMLLIRLSSTPAIDIYIIYSYFYIYNSGGWVV